MSSLILFILFALLMILGIPIALSLGISTIIYILLFVNVPVSVVVQQMLGGVNSFTLLAIPFFIIAGNLMDKGGISKRIISFSNTLVGWIPGGLTIVLIVSSMIFAAMTGAGAATVAAIGAIMIPAMKEEGYDEDFSSALQATAGVFGPIIPPSILMVLYGVVTDVSVGALLLAGVIPGVLLGLILMIITLVLCYIKGYRGKGSWNIKTVVSSFKEAFFALISPVIVLGGIYSGIVTPTEAAALIALYSLIIGLFVYKELSLRDLLDVLAYSMKVSAGIMLIVASTQAFGWVLTREQIPQMIGEWFISISNNQYFFMFGVIGILLIVGTFLDPVPAVMIFAPIFSPAARLYGIDDIHFAVIVIVSLCIGLVTPPIGMNLFVASSISHRPVHLISKHLIPFLIAMLFGLIIIVLVPGISTYLPKFILK